MNSQTVLVSNPGIGQKASSLASPSSLLSWVGVSLMEEWGKSCWEKEKVQSCWEWNHSFSGFDVVSTYVGIL